MIRPTIESDDETLKATARDVVGFPAICRSTAISIVCVELEDERLLSNTQQWGPENARMRLTWLALCIP